MTNCIDDSHYSVSCFCNLLIVENERAITIALVSLSAYALSAFIQTNIHICEDIIFRIQILFRAYFHTFIVDVIHFLTIYNNLIQFYFHCISHQFCFPFFLNENS